MPIDPAEKQFEKAKRAFEALGAIVSVGFWADIVDRSKLVPYRLFQLNDATDADLRALPAVSFSFDLDLSRAKVTDAAMTELAKFKNLSSLHVAYTSVSDLSLKDICNCKQLAKLYLSRTL